MKKSFSDVVKVLKKLQSNPGKYNLSPEDMKAIKIATDEIKNIDDLSNMSTGADILLKLVKFIDIISDILGAGQMPNSP